MTETFSKNNNWVIDFYRSQNHSMLKIDSKANQLYSRPAKYPTICSRASDTVSLVSYVKWALSNSSYMKLWSTSQALETKIFFLKCDPWAIYWARDNQTTCLLFFCFYIFKNLVTALLKSWMKIEVKHKSSLTFQVLLCLCHPEPQRNQ